METWKKVESKTNLEVVRALCFLLLMFFAFILLRLLAE